MPPIKRPAEENPYHPHNPYPETHSFTHNGKRYEFDYGAGIQSPAGFVACSSIRVDAGPESKLAKAGLIQTKSSSGKVPDDVRDAIIHTLGRKVGPVMVQLHVREPWEFGIGEMFTRELEAEMNKARDEILAARKAKAEGK